MADDAGDKELGKLSMKNSPKRKGMKMGASRALHPSEGSEAHYPTLRLHRQLARGAIADGQLILQDEYQRRQIWDPKKSSRLIELLLLNVPIPVCYSAELDDGTFSVIDGQQRLTSISRYIAKSFPLSGLRVGPELNKKRFSEFEKAVSD